jgi:thioredoxin reductase
VTRYIIIGAGPGGLQLGYFLQRAGADYVILERESGPGSFFARYPRHRRLISLNKVHVADPDPEIALRWDWNSLLSDDPALLFREYSAEYFPHADVMCRYLADFHRKHRINVRFNRPVERVAGQDHEFVVMTPEENVYGECVIVAAGWGGPYVPPIPGIEHAIGYEDVSGAERFAGQRVLIVGKGNSAFETAQALLGHAEVLHLASPSPVRLAWNSKHPGDVRGQYGALLDSYWFKTLHAVLECEIERIWRADGGLKAAIRYTLAGGERTVLDYDSVIRCTGFTMPAGIFGQQPETMLNGRLPVVRPDWQSVNVDGMYFAGTLMQGRDVRHASSAFVDGFRYNLRTLAALLLERYDGVAFPCATVNDLAGTMLRRVNWSSALWTQFEYLCDAYVVDGMVRHYADIPEDYALTRFGDQRHWYTVTLCWGRRDYPDVFAIQRRPDPEFAHESAFLHPVIRRWRGREVVAERHLLEDLHGRWQDPVRHVRPLREFVATQLGS